MNNHIQLGITDIWEMSNHVGPSLNFLASDYDLHIPAHSGLKQKDFYCSWKYNSCIYLLIMNEMM